MSRYVPPALRIKQQQQENQSSASAPGETSQAFRPRRLEDLRLQAGSSDGLSLADIHDHFRKESARFLGVQSTLNATASNPDRLGYLILFSDANPRWSTDQLLFAKTKIDLLPGYEEAFAEPPNSEPIIAPSTLELFSGKDQTEESVESPGEPVAVFEQSSGYRRDKESGFSFTGWFQLERVDFLQPFSEELARMLGQKWSRKDKFGRETEIKRDSEAWKRSMGHRWAVVKMKKTSEQPPAPIVKPDSARLCNPKVNLLPT